MAVAADVDQWVSVYRASRLCDTSRHSVMLAIANRQLSAQVVAQRTVITLESLERWRDARAELAADDAVLRERAKPAPKRSAAHTRASRTTRADSPRRSA